MGNIDDQSVGQKPTVAAPPSERRFFYLRFVKPSSYQRLGRKPRTGDDGQHMQTSFSSQYQGAQIPSSEAQPSGLAHYQLPVAYTFTGRFPYGDGTTYPYRYYSQFVSQRKTGAPGALVSTATTTTTTAATPIINFSPIHHTDLQQHPGNPHMQCTHMV